MNLSSRLATITVATALTVLLGACSSTPVAPVTATSNTTPKPAMPLAAKPAGSQPVVTAPIAPHLDPASALYQKRSVYFDFDQYTVKPEYTPVLEMHGKYLAAHANIRIKVEGNTDAQGGTEYNLALGQKRAEAVVRALKVFGAKDAQLEAVSFGKEKPKSTGHDEAALAQNRRADLAYPQK